MVIDKGSVVIGGEGAELKGKDFEFLLGTMFHIIYLYFSLISI